jgi:hypothetical protein
VIVLRGEISGPGKGKGFKMMGIVGIPTLTKSLVIMKESIDPLSVFVVGKCIFFTRKVARNFCLIPYGKTLR